MLDKIKSNIKGLLKKALSPRDAEPRFVNPYGMTDATTPQYYVQPKYKDGRFILERDEPIPPRNPEGKPVENKNVKVVTKKEGGLTKELISVVISDIEGIAGETKKKTEKSTLNKEKYEQFKELAMGKKDE